MGVNVKANAPASSVVAVCTGCQPLARRTCHVTNTPGVAGSSAPASTTGDPIGAVEGASVAVTPVATETLFRMRDGDHPAGPSYAARMSTLVSGCSQVSAWPLSSVTTLTGSDHVVVPADRLCTST